MMRVYGRLTNEDGTKSWQEVTTDARGYNDNVYLTALAQVLKLNTGESPFYSNFGIGAVQAVHTQIYPDYDMMRTQNQYSQFFGSLVITLTRKNPRPYYNVQVVTHSGAILESRIPV